MHGVDRCSEQCLKKPEKIQVVQTWRKTCKDILQSLQQHCRVWGMGQARLGNKCKIVGGVFWRVAVQKITNMIIDLSAVLFASNKSLNSGTFCWIYSFNINNTEKHRCLAHFKCTHLFLMVIERLKKNIQLVFFLLKRNSKRMISLWWTVLLEENKKELSLPNMKHTHN